MRILVIDKEGLALDWCLRCQQAGHKVKWYIPPKDKFKAIGQGLTERIKDWHEFIRWADLVFLSDNTFALREMDAWRARGIKIVGATQESSRLELDRAFAMNLFRKHGIEVPDFKEFSDYDKAIAFVKKEDRPFVSKPCGDEPDKSLSYVAKTPADLVYMLERWKKSAKLKGQFLLQEKVEGCEMAVGGWFGPGGFNEGWCENWEEKKLMDGALGPNTSEMGTTIRMVSKSKLANKILAPFAETLEEMGHSGYIDVNCMIGEDGTIYPLEFTARPGWPTFNIQQVLNKSDPAQWLLDLVDGVDARNWKMNEIAVGIVMAIPDFPYSQKPRDEVVGIPLYGLKPSIMDRVHPCEVMLGEAPIVANGKMVEVPIWVTAGDYVLVATGTGKTVHEARMAAYRTVKQCAKMPGSPMYRTDISKHLAKLLEVCQQNGFATGLAFR